MRISRINRIGVYRPASTGLDDIPDSGGMDGGGECEFESQEAFEDSGNSMRTVHFKNTESFVAAYGYRPYGWLSFSRRGRFTRQRYRYLSHLFDAPEPHVSPLDHDEDFRRANKRRAWNFARVLKFHRLKQKRRKESA